MDSDSLKKLQLAHCEKYLGKVLRFNSNGQRASAGKVVDYKLDTAGIGAFYILERRYHGYMETMETYLEFPKELQLPYFRSGKPATWREKYGTESRLSNRNVVT